MNSSKSHSSFARATPTNPSTYKSSYPLYNSNSNITIPYAPIYTPTIDEFRNPYEYIHRIRSEAQQYGICKIIPPPSWKPNKQFQWNTQKFMTKIQCINELQSRATYDINSIQQHDNDNCNQHIDEWVKQHASALSNTNPSSMNGTMKYQPERMNNNTCNESTSSSITPSSDSSNSSVDEALFEDSTICSISLERTNSDAIPTTPILSRTMSDTSTINDSNKRARKLPTRFVDESSNTITKSNDKRTNRLKRSKSSANKPSYESDHSTTICAVCSGGSHDNQMLLCDGCDCGVHLFCLTRPLTSVPDGDWYCSDCQAQREHWFGFGTGGEYTLNEFKLYSEYYVHEYFVKRKNYDNVSNIKHNDIVNEYWNIVERADHTDPVTVKYGSDVDTQQFDGPYTSTEYDGDGWNCNNLALLPESMLSFLDASVISGVTTPWLYIGMIFSSFCWHNEDQYCHSINYLHHGSNKQWYGIPSSSAHIFEQLMCTYNPDMFQSCPDLLFHLVTMLSPNRLINNKINQSVQLYQVIQEQGEIVITFPQAYHGGFNCGFNIAESVNFACNDWLPMGMKCLDRWRSFRRVQCFSNDRLLCNIAHKFQLQQQHNKLDHNDIQRNQSTAINTTRDELAAVAGHGHISIETAAWLLPVMKKLRDRELRGREILYKLGIINGKHWIHDDLAINKKNNQRLAMSSHTPNIHINNDSQPYCVICKHYLWVSCVKCICQPNKHACLAHSNELCECNNNKKSIYFRYDIAQLNKYIRVLEQSICTDNIQQRKQYTLIITESQSILDTVDQYPIYVNVNDQRLKLIDTPNKINGNNSTDNSINNTVTVKKLKNDKSSNTNQYTININDITWSKSDIIQYINKSIAWCNQVDGIFRELTNYTVNNGSIIQYATVLSHGEQYIWHDERFNKCRTYYNKLSTLYDSIQLYTTQYCKLHTLYAANRDSVKEFNDKYQRTINAIKSNHNKINPQWLTDIIYYSHVVPGKIQYSDAKTLLNQTQQLSQHKCCACQINHYIQIQNWCKFIDELMSTQYKQFKSIDDIVICIQTCIKIPIQINKLHTLYEWLLQHINILYQQAIPDSNTIQLSDVNKISNHNDAAKQLSLHKSCHTFNNLVANLDSTQHSIASIHRMGQAAVLLHSNTILPININDNTLYQQLHEHEAYIYCSKQLLNSTKQYVIDTSDLTDYHSYQCPTCQKYYYINTQPYNLCCWEYIELYWNKHPNVSDYCIEVFKLVLQQYRTICNTILNGLPLKLQLKFTSKHKITHSRNNLHVDEVIQLQSQLAGTRIIMYCNKSQLNNVLQLHVHDVRKWQQSNQSTVAELYNKYDELLCSRTDNKLYTRLMNDCKMILLEATNLHIISNETLLIAQLINKLHQLKHSIAEADSQPPKLNTSISK